MICPSESLEQKALCQWWAVQSHLLGLPSFLLFAIPNGGRRDAITGARLKDEGVRPGIPDLMLAVPNDIYAGMFIELKKRNGGRVSKSQQEVIPALNGQGYKVVVCHGWEEAQQEIMVYLAISRCKSKRNENERRQRNTGSVVNTTRESAVQGAGNN